MTEFQAEHLIDLLEFNNSLLIDLSNVLNNFYVLMFWSVTVAIAAVIVIYFIFKPIYNLMLGRW